MDETIAGVCAQALEFQKPETIASHSQPIEVKARMVIFTQQVRRATRDESDIRGSFQGVGKDYCGCNGQCLYCGNAI